MTTFRYTRHDGIYYRRPADKIGLAVHDMLQGSQWVRYDGDDASDIGHFGAPVDEAEVSKGIRLAQGAA